MAEHSKTTFIGPISFTGTNHAGITVISLTTAQRDALTPTNGTLIYNTSNARFEKYEAGGWQPTSSGSLPKIAVIVGASQADYITDGTTDNVEIQQAIDAVTAAGGGHVYLQAGTYNLAATINLKSNVILEGQGVGTILKPVSGTSIITAYSSGGAITCQTISQAAVMSLRIDGTNFQHDSAAVHIDNCSDIKVGNCRIDNINGFGVFTTAGLTGSASGTTQRVTIFNNYIYGYGLNDLIGGGAYTTTATVTDVKAYANELIQDCTVNGYGNAIDMIGTTRMTITGNDSTGSINMGTEHGNHSYMVISGNTIKPAINLSSSNGRIQVTASSLSTANSDTITISNNTLMSVGSIGVKGISTMYLQNVAITGNVLKGNTTQSGIQLWFTQQATVTGNTVDGAYSCVQILSSTNAHISGNSFNNANYGVNEDSSTASIVIGDNHYNNIAIGRTVGGNTSLVSLGMTTTQRNTLPTVNGTIIYNTTTSQVEAYENGNWKSREAKKTTTVGFSDADYICDGTSDDVQIQQAINYVGGTLGGGSVYIKGGTTAYDISATLTINYNNVRLIGDGASTKLRLKNAANVNGINIGTSIADGYSGVVLQDFYFDGNRTNQTGDNVTQGTSYGCVMYSCSQCVFQNVSFNNWSVIGVFVGGTTFRRNGHHKIINCEASNCNFDGFEYNFCNYNLIENCIAQGNGHGGIYDKGGTGNMIVGNDCSLNNYLLGFGGNALVVQFTTKGIYTNNQCSGGYASGFGCQDVDQAIITNNTCCTTGFDGLRFDGIKNSLISGNICNDNGQFGGSSKNGINLFKTNGTFDCTNNIISGNYCGNLAGSTQAYGIITQNTSDSNLVTDNILQGNGTAPLNLVGTSNVVKNNTNWNPDVFYSQGNVTGATIFDRKNGYHVLATATGNITTTVTNGKTTGDELVLEIKQDTTGGRTISKPSNVKLVGGAFSPTATANATDVWSLRWDGTSWVETGRSLNVS
jgi:parallel beta-helix repeat protein